MVKVVTLLIRMASVIWNVTLHILKTFLVVILFHVLPLLKFVNAVAEPAEKANHHPDIDIRWNKVTLVLSTHDAGGLTEKDFSLAKQFDRL